MSKRHQVSDAVSRSTAPASRCGSASGVVRAHAPVHAVVPRHAQEHRHGLAGRGRVVGDVQRGAVVVGLGEQGREGIVVSP